jgi:hypothetical protein
MTAWPPDGIWPWAALVGLGAFHGINPAMGWLFAVAIGLQTGRSAAVIQSLPPIVLGHSVSIALVAGTVAMATLAFDPLQLQLPAALGMIGFGAYRLARGYRHRFRVGMVAGFCDLVVWSFLMATAHGAGLMIVPVLLRMPLCLPPGLPPGLLEDGQATVTAALTGSLWIGLLAVAAHALATLVVTGMVAWVVFRWIGLAVLRKGWINLDFGPAYHLE